MVKSLRVLVVLLVVALVAAPGVTLAHGPGDQPGDPYGDHMGATPSPGTYHDPQVGQMHTDPYHGDDWDHPGSHMFPKTGHQMGGAFLDYWEHNGGLPVFGYPLTDERSEQGMTVQYLERQRFEYHPEHAGTPYVVELGRLGYEDAQRLGLLSTAPFQPLPASTQSDANVQFFPETGHLVGFGFKAYWQSHGLDLGDPGISFRESLALFGYPISEEFQQNGMTVQYFERAVFEYHPGNPEPYTILLRRLGADMLS